MHRLQLHLSYCHRALSTMSILHSRNCGVLRQRLSSELRRIGYTGCGGFAMNHQLAGGVFFLTLFGVSAPVLPLAAQSPSGPMTPLPGAAIQQAPKQAKIGVSVALVNT